MLTPPPPPPTGPSCAIHPVAFRLGVPVEGSWWGPQGHGWGPLLHGLPACSLHRVFAVPGLLLEVRYVKRYHALHVVPYAVRFSSDFQSSEVCKGGDNREGHLGFVNFLVLSVAKARRMPMLGTKPVYGDMPPKTTSPLCRAPRHG